MARVDQEAEPAVREAEGPRRSALLQDRSRRTRRRLVRAALALWTERGFERGVEETTVEEIARAAGVTKGTFYFHFAHKEDILLELGWGTAEVLYEEAVDGVAGGLPAETILDGLLASLARRVQSVPKMATARSVAEFNRPDRPVRTEGHFALWRSFAVVLEAEREQGLLGPDVDVDVDEVAIMLEVLLMDVLSSWARSDLPLMALLRQRTAVLLAGARAVVPTIVSRPALCPRPETGPETGTETGPGTEAGTATGTAGEGPSPGG